MTRFSVTLNYDEFKLAQAISDSWDYSATELDGISLKNLDTYSSVVAPEKIVLMLSEPEGVALAAALDIYAVQNHLDQDEEMLAEGCKIEDIAGKIRNQIWRSP